MEQTSAVMRGMFSYFLNRLVRPNSDSVLTLTALAASAGSIPDRLTSSREGGSGESVLDALTRYELSFESPVYVYILRVCTT